MQFKTLKYVIVDSCQGQKAILFSQDVSHCDIYDYKKIISAGFVSLTYNGKIEGVWGKATSFKSTPLNKSIHSRPEDANIINQTLKVGPWDYGLTEEQLDSLPEVAKIFERETKEIVDEFESES